MEIEINFTPQRLKSLVKELEKRIGVATGQPLRLDTELYLKILRKYKETPIKENLPTLATLEKLSLLIPMLRQEELVDTFFYCLQNTTNSEITSAILDYYFNNYSDLLAKAYLLGSIHKEVLNKKGWETWSRHREVFFKGNVIENISGLIIQQRIQLQDIPEWIGMSEPYKIREDSLSYLCSNKEVFDSYMRVLRLESVLSLLKNDELQSLHASIWNYTLPQYSKEAIEQKNKNDSDHPLFSLAKLRLQPIKTPQWLRLSNEAKNAYQEWALGSRLEAFFEKDTDNKRILFWKRYLRSIEEIKEVNHRGSIEAFAILIGKYEFVEFRDIGAIHVYQKGSIRIPNRVVNLDELKFRSKVVNFGKGHDHGEGWQPHWGSAWQGRVDKLINEALRT